MAFQIATLAPVKWGTTVLAVTDVTVSPGISEQSITHSGGLSATIHTKSRSEQRVTFRVPFALAHATFGTAASVQTTFEVYSSKFADGVKAGATSHPAWKLVAGASAMAIITGYSVSQGGVLFADVEVAIISADGTTAPLEYSADNTLPTLASQPVLHTNGKCSVNGSVIPGTSGWSVTTGNSFQVPANDGDMYPTSIAVLEATPSLTVNHQDPIGVLDSIGMLGDTITADVVVYANSYVDNKVAKSNAVAITVGAGELSPNSISLAQGSVASTGILVSPLSSDGSTYPLTIATNATAP